MTPSSVSGSLLMAASLWLLASLAAASPMMSSSLGKRLTSNAVAELKRPKELYSFGIGELVGIVLKTFYSELFAN